MKQEQFDQPFPKEEASGVGCDSVNVKDEVLDTSDDKRSADEMSGSPGSGTLPPRKRAKTKDEKEQRRVERIMRNRQAAHASREKKRKHLEELEAKCETLTRTNADLEIQLQRAQRLQVESQERQLAMQTRLGQFESVLHLAKSSGDLTVLENLATESQPVAEDPLPSECTSPGNLQLLSIPSLSNSVGNSPAHVDDSEDFEPLDPFSAFPSELAIDNSSKAHHPAAMM